MNTIAFRQNLIVDEDHTIHLTIPPEMGHSVEVFVFAQEAVTTSLQHNSLAISNAMDESGFSKTVLNNVEEDCWNDL